MCYYILASGFSISEANGKKNLDTFYNIQDSFHDNLKQASKFDKLYRLKKSFPQSRRISITSYSLNHRTCNSDCFSVLYKFFKRFISRPATGASRGFSLFVQRQLFHYIGSYRSLSVTHLPHDSVGAWIGAMSHESLVRSTTAPFSDAFSTIITIPTIESFFIFRFVTARPSFIYFFFFSCSTNSCGREIFPFTIKTKHYFSNTPPNCRKKKHQSIWILRNFFFRFHRISKNFISTFSIVEK